MQPGAAPCMEASSFQMAGTGNASDRMINTGLAQKGNSVKMRSAFFVYKVFKPSHFWEVIAANPLQYWIRATELARVGAWTGPEKWPMDIPILGNGIDFVHSLSTFTIP
jgi:hypothetical protein